MIIALLLIPIFMILASMYLYRFSGRRELFHFDLVQFLYSFLIYPLGYVWMKNFLFVLLTQENGMQFSPGRWMVIDTIFTIFFLYFYAFGIIHSLTKTLSLQLNRDPLFDLFEQFKYFHEFLSHVGMYCGTFFVISVLSLANTLFPFAVTLHRNTFWGLVAFGWTTGIFLYIGLFFLTDKGVQYARYKKLIRLTYGASFVLHIIAYLILTPAFNLHYAAYWLTFCLLTSLVMCTFFLHPTDRVLRYLTLIRMNKGID